MLYTCPPTVKTTRLIQRRPVSTTNINAKVPKYIEGECMFGGKFKKEAILYNVKWNPTGHTYIGKSQGHLRYGVNKGKANGLKPCCNL